MKKKPWIIILIVSIVCIFLIGAVVYIGIKMYAKSLLIPEDIRKQDSETISKYCNQKTGFDKDTCYFQIALKVFNNSDYSDGQYCLKINNAQQKMACILAYATYWNNTNLCNQIDIDDGQILCRAITLKDISLCNGISDANIKSSCQNQVDKIVNKEENDVNNCMKINIPDDRDACLYYLAYNYHNYNICNPIKNETLRMNCIVVNIYYHYQNYHCADLEGKQKDMCFAFAATTEKNVTICENIMDAVWRSACLNPKQ